MLLMFRGFFSGSHPTNHQPHVQVDALLPSPGRPAPWLLYAIQLFAQIARAALSLLFGVPNFEQNLCAVAAMPLHPSTSHRRLLGETTSSRFKATAALLFGEPMLPAPDRFDWKTSAKRSSSTLCRCKHSPGTNPQCARPARRFGANKASATMRRWKLVADPPGFAVHAQIGIR